jgi:hypothetical protein
VDVCHFSEHPYREGLLYTHSIDHVTGQAVPSHQWVEGFLDYYHLTGNPVGYQTALTIGEKLLELVNLPLYMSTATVQPREIGWALRSFCALYNETHDPKWLDACDPIADIYIQWAQECGSWSSPYPDNYMAREPFMITVGIVGLYNYYAFRPKDAVKAVIIAVVDDMIGTCYNPRIGTFYGKLPFPVRFLNQNGMVLQSLAIAYELTGDKAYLEVGFGMFDWITKENLPPIYDFAKVKRDDFTIIYNCSVGPKRCAQTLGPLLHYYKYMVELGYLK